jgi:hypothetical protein
VEDDVPQPGQSDVRVRVLAAGASFTDAQLRAGTYLGVPKPPFTATTTAVRLREVSGPAKIVEEGALEHLNMLAKKYLGEDKYPYLGPGERRVIIQIHPERVDGFGAGA